MQNILEQQRNILKIQGQSFDLNSIRNRKNEVVQVIQENEESCVLLNNNNFDELNLKHSSLEKKKSIQDNQVTQSDFLINKQNYLNEKFSKNSQVKNQQQKKKTCDDQKRISSKSQVYFYNDGIKFHVKEQSQIKYPNGNKIQKLNSPHIQKIKENVDQQQFAQLKQTIQLYNIRMPSVPKIQRLENNDHFLPLKNLNIQMAQNQNNYQKSEFIQELERNSCDKLVNSSYIQKFFPNSKTNSSERQIDLNTGFQNDQWKKNIKNSIININKNQLISNEGKNYERRKSPLEQKNYQDKKIEYLDKNQIQNMEQSIKKQNTIINFQELKLIPELPLKDLDLSQDSQELESLIQQQVGKNVSMKAIEIWLNNILRTAEENDDKYCLKIIQKSNNALKDYNIDRLSLIKSGIPPEVVDTIYRQLFVSSSAVYHIFQNLITSFSNQKNLDNNFKNKLSKGALISSLWKVYMILMEFHNPSLQKSMLMDVIQDAESKYRERELVYDQILMQEKSSVQIWKDQIQKLEEELILKTTECDEQKFRLKDQEQKLELKSSVLEKEIQIRLQFELRLSHLNALNRNFNNLAIQKSQKVIELESYLKQLTSDYQTLVQNSHEIKSSNVIGEQFKIQTQQIIERMDNDKKYQQEILDKQSKDLEQFSCELKDNQKLVTDHKRTIQELYQQNDLLTLKNNDLIKINQEYYSKNLQLLEQNNMFIQEFQFIQDQKNNLDLNYNFIQNNQNVKQNKIDILYEEKIIIMAQNIQLSQYQEGLKIQIQQLEEKISIKDYKIEELQKSNDEQIYKIKALDSHYQSMIMLDIKQKFESQLMETKLKNINNINIKYKDNIQETDSKMTQLNTQHDKVKLLYQNLQDQNGMEKLLNENQTKVYEDILQANLKEIRQIKFELQNQISLNFQQEEKLLSINSKNLQQSMKIANLEQDFKKIHQEFENINQLKNQLMVETQDSAIRAESMYRNYTFAIQNNQFQEELHQKDSQKIYQDYSILQKIQQDQEMIFEDYLSLIMKFDQQIIKLDQQVKILNEKIIKNEDSNELLIIQMHQKNEEIQSCYKQINNAQQQIDQLQNYLQDSQNILDSKEQLINNKNSLIESLNFEMVDLKFQLTEKDQKNQFLRQKIKNLKDIPTTQDAECQFSIIYNPYATPNSIRTQSSNLININEAQYTQDYNLQQEENFNLKKNKEIQLSQKKLKHIEAINQKKELKQFRYELKYQSRGSQCNFLKPIVLIKSSIQNNYENDNESKQQNKINQNFSERKSKQSKINMEIQLSNSKSYKQIKKIQSLQQSLQDLVFNQNSFKDIDFEAIFKAPSETQQFDLKNEKNNNEDLEQVHNEEYKQKESINNQEYNNQMASEIGVGMNKYKNIMNCQCNCCNHQDLITEIINNKGNNLNILQNNHQNQQQNIDLNEKDNTDTQSDSLITKPTCSLISKPLESQPFRANNISRKSSLQSLQQFNHKNSNYSKQAFNKYEFIKKLDKNNENILIKNKINQEQRQNQYKSLILNTDQQMNDNMLNRMERLVTLKEKLQQIKVIDNIQCISRLINNNEQSFQSNKSSQICMEGLPFIYQKYSSNNFNYQKSTMFEQHQTQQKWHKRSEISTENMNNLAINNKNKEIQNQNIDKRHLKKKKKEQFQQYFSQNQYSQSLKDNQKKRYSSVKETGEIRKQNQIIITGTKTFMPYD